MSACKKHYKLFVLGEKYKHDQHSVFRFSCFILENMLPLFRCIFKHDSAPFISDSSGKFQTTAVLEDHLYPIMHLFLKDNNVVQCSGSSQ